jgi:hypothetical protein
MQTFPPAKGLRVAGRPRKAPSKVSVDEEESETLAMIVLLFCKGLHARLNSWLRLSLDQPSARPATSTIRVGAILQCLSGLR